MAEGGGEEKDDKNPFSFESFVKKKPNDDSEGVNTNRVHVRPNDTYPPSRASRREDNPFSFKQFLKKDGPSSKPKVYSFIVDDISETCGGSRSRTLTPDFATDLPDFVQDHIVADGNHESRLNRNINATNECNDDARNSVRGDRESLPQLPTLDEIEHPFPDLTLDDHMVNASCRDAGNNISDSSSNYPNPDSNEVNHFDDKNDNVIPLRLPDFLSDGPMLNHVPSAVDANGASEVSQQLNDRCPHCNGVRNSGQDLNVNSHSSDEGNELERLRHENGVILQQLESSRALAESEHRKVLSLQEEVKTLKSKEATETAALEEMVRQVEKNLQLTTQRAVKAENSGSKLKQEVKTLQNELVKLSEENNSLRNGSVTLVPEEIRGKATNISTMLNCAANDAETSLKQLMRGVDHLRFLSTVAQNIDKVTETSSASESDLS